jgi:hypothetical protein
MLRTIWGDNARYVSAYWEMFKNRFYVAGDSAHRDKDGYFWIMGRIDDVLNVAGHRLGTMEIQSALVAHARVAEAAVVGKPHDIKGESVFAYVVTRGTRPAGDTTALVKELRDWVGQQLGPIAKPDDIRFADNLPKTRSGKIMRRLLKAIARGEEITQDVSTLENPAILDQLRGTDAKAARAAAPASPPADGRTSVKKAAQPAAPGKQPARKAARVKAAAKKRVAPKKATAKKAAARQTARRKSARKKAPRAHAKTARRPARHKTAARRHR